MSFLHLYILCSPCGAGFGSGGAGPAMLALLVFVSIDLLIQIYLGSIEPCTLHWGPHALGWPQPTLDFLPNLFSASNNFSGCTNSISTLCKTKSLAQALSHKLIGE